MYAWACENNISLGGARGNKSPCLFHSPGLIWSIMTLQPLAYLFPCEVLLSRTRVVLFELGLGRDREERPDQ